MTIQDQTEPASAGSDRPDWGPTAGSQGSAGGTTGRSGDPGTREDGPRRPPMDAAGTAPSAAPLDVRSPDELLDGTEAAPAGDHAPAAPRAGFRWRRYLAPRLAALALIVGGAWYLQSGRPLPFVGGSGSSTPRGDTAGFVTFGTAGIKLGASAGAAPKIGEPATDFTLLDPSGNVVRLSDFRGKTVVMNFWATWCPPCRKEFPELVRLYNQNADRGLVVLGVDLQESPEIVRNFLNEFDAKYPVVIDTKGDVAAGYRLLGLPTTYFIDGDGVIRAQHIGELTGSILAQKLTQTGFGDLKGQ